MFGYKSKANISHLFIPTYDINLNRIFRNARNSVYVLFGIYVAPNHKKLSWGNVMWHKTLCGNGMVLSIETFHLKSKYSYQTKENRKLQSGTTCPFFCAESIKDSWYPLLFLHRLHEITPNFNRRLTLSSL